MEERAYRRKGDDHTHIIAKPDTMRWPGSGNTAYTGGSKPLYDYFTYANLYQPCAALLPGAHFNTVNAARANARCQSLADGPVNKPARARAAARKAPARKTRAAGRRPK